MKLVLLLFSSIFLLAGCGVSLPEPGPAPEPLAQEVDSDPIFDYQNTRFGYAFNVPEGYSLYALTQDQTAVLADEQSEVVFLVEDETNLFTIRGIEGRRSAHEWVTQNISFFYPTGDAAQRVAEFAGHQAIVLKGSGGSESPARLIVFQYQENLIVISYEQDTSTFESLLEEFSTI